MAESSLKLKQYIFKNIFETNDIQNNSTISALFQTWMTNILLEEGETESTKSVVKVGIQGLPGTKFSFIGDGASASWIMIDHTGVYEIDLTGTSTTISTIAFDPISLANIMQTNNATLIVDILYK